MSEETPTQELDKNSFGYKVRVALNKGSLGFARNWAIFLTAIFAIYAGLPWVAPMAMHAGATGFGNTLYTIYGPVCHQMAFRSWFLYGEQIAYPRERANATIVQQTFEDVAVTEAAFAEVNDLSELEGDLMVAARRFRGNERLGYKVAICQRDASIYGMLALFGVAFVILTKLGVRVPYLPFWAYLLIAIVPIGLDGFSQWFANPPFNGFGLPFYPIRESPPFIRTFTGALFGLGNGWLAYPYIEDSMKDTAETLERKLVKAGLIEPRDG